MTARGSLSGIRLSTLDYLVSVMDSPQSHLDFTIALRFNEQIDSDALRAGASSARNLFPTTGSRLKNNRWVRDLATGNGIATLGSWNGEDLMKDFVNRPIDLVHESPVQQLVMTSDADNATTLVTKFHHAAADGTSASLWLNHQLAVAFGFEKVRKEQSPFEPLSLKQLSTTVRRSQFAYATPSEQLWTLPAQRSGVRAWTSISFEANRLRKACRKTQGFTYSDLLATCALQVFSLWNGERRGEHIPKVGLWLPINIRRRSAEGFGNGTSRIRIYANYPPTMSLIDKCREVRRQITWCSNHGEWVVPQVTPMTLLPRWATRPVIRRHLTRASIDMATGVFSHVERWNNKKELFTALESLECVGLLHPFQALAINGATHNGKTWLTFTYDASLFEPQHVERLVNLYVEQIELAGQTLQ
jgi:NRPS condensation-like uncharacterized protein